MKPGRMKPGGSRLAELYRFGLAAMMGLHGGACEPRADTFDLPDERVWQSEHFRYASRSTDDGVCPDVLDELERHHAALSDYFGLELAPRIAYFKFTDAADLAEHGTCSSHNRACYEQGVGVQSTDALNLHELVHAYLAPLGERHALLEEGLAEALSCGAQPVSKPDALEPQLAFEPRTWTVGTAQSFRAAYSAARWFVGFALRKYGAQPFLRWYSRVERDYGFAEAAWLFQDIYGLELEQLWSAAFASDDPDTGCARVWECAQPRPLRSDASPGCSGPSELGSLHLPEPGWVLQHSTGVGSRFDACDPRVRLATEAEWTERGLEGESVAYALPSGRYFATQNAQQGSSHVELYNSGALPGPDCPDSPQVRVDFNAELVLTVATPESSYLLVEDLAAVGLGYQLGCSPGASVSWCEACGDCRPGCDSNVTVSEPQSRPRVLRLRIDGRPRDGFWVRLTRTL